MRVFKTAGESGRGVGRRAGESEGRKRRPSAEALDARVLLSATPAAIGVNFTGGGNNGSAPALLAATDAAGVVSRPNFNNAAGGSGTLSNLTASTGNPSPASVQWTSAGTFASVPAPFAAATPDQALNDGFVYGTATTAVSVTVTGIPFSTYDVYVYELNDATGRLSVTTDTGANQSFYGTSPASANAAHESGAAGTYSYVQATATTQAAAAAADYVLFATRSGPSFTFTESSPNNNGYVNGFEVVDHPLAAPSAPVLGTPTAAPGSVALSWAAATNADTYTVYRSGPGGTAATAIATGLVSPTYTDTTVTNGSAYSYYVTAVNALGVSGNSNAQQVTAPLPVTIVKAAAANPSPLTGSSATLSVSATDAANGTDLTYTWATTGTPAAPVTFSPNGTNSAASTTASFTQTGTYAFVVTATNPAGLTATSTLSLPVTVPQATPAQPTGVSASQGTNGVSVSWLPAAGAATYSLYRGSSAGDEGATPVYTGITGTTYTDAAATAGGTYYYEVAAVSSTGIASVRSAEVLATVPVDMLSYHGGSPTSQGVNDQETQLTPGDLATASFGLDYTTSITDVPNLDGIPASTLPTNVDYTDPDGQPYGQPLVKTAVPITTGPYAGTVRNVVFVTNQLGSLFAIDADGGSVLWKDSFVYNAAGNPNPLNAAVPNGTTAIPGGYGTETNSQDVSPWICIVGTPVVSAAGNALYLITNTRYVPGGPSGDQANPHYLFTIHKVNLSNGVDTSSVFADTTLGYANPNNPTYTYNGGPYTVGTGEGATTVGGQSRVYFNAVRQMIRPALELYNGRVYATSASHGDNQPYHGWVLTFDASTLAVDGAFDASPNGDEAGIWSGGGGPVFDGQGNFYVVTGNGTFDGDFTTANGTTTYTGLDANGFPALGDYGDAFLKLATDPTTTAANQGVNGWGIKVVDYFTPQNNDALDGADTDVGAGGLTLLPASAGSAAHPNLVVGGGKEGKLYLLDTDNLGKFTSNDAGAVQEVGNAVNGILSTPAFFNGRLYVSPGYGGSVVSWAVSNAQIATASEQATPDSIAFPGSSPAISADGTLNGVVWVVDKGTGSVRAYDAGNLSDELWTSNLAQGRDALPGGAVKFSVATPVNGRVYVASNNALAVYGPPLPPTASPAAPSGLTVTATGVSTVTLAWTDNSNNETGFDIERSTDGVNFTPVATESVNVTAHVDGNLNTSTTYYYRIRSYNSFNGTSYSAYSNVVTAATTSIGTQQPVDLYHFDAGAGTTVTDSTGTNTGTLQGSPLPAWTTPGRVGTADLTFTGNGQYQQTGESAVRVANDLSPILGGTSTLDVWVKTTQAGNTTHWQAPAVTGVEQAAAANDINWGTLNAAGDIGIYVGESGGLYSSAPVDDGNWHNVAITRNATTGVVQLYVDGVLNGTTTLETGLKTSAFQLIGALQTDANDGVTPTGANYFNGQLDEVRIYNLVVDPAVIDSLSVAPPAPTNLAVTAGSGTELDLTWTTNSPYATGYVLQRRIGTGPWVSLPTLPPGTTSYNDTGLTPSTAYSYQLQAIDTAGASPFTPVVTATTPVPPATPSNTVASQITTTQIFLTWTNNATTATGYRILRATIGGEFVVITPPNGLPATATSYLDAGLTPGTEYDYHIQCYNIAGVSDFTGTSTGTLAVAPTNVTAAAAGANAVTVTWTAPAYNGNGRDLTYNVYRGTTPGGESANPVATGVPSTTYADTGLSPGVTYYYTVTAVDRGGVGAASAEARAVDAVSWTGGADGVAWNAPGNWSDDLVPTAADAVAIGSFSTTIRVPAGTFAAATLSSATPISVGAGSTLTLAGTSSLGAGLTVAAGGTVGVAGTGVLEVTGLALVAGGTVDVGTGYLVVRNSTPAAVAGYVAGGYAGGTWSGTGITSSAARTDAARLHAVGTLPNNDGSGNALYGAGSAVPQFGGYVPLVNDVLVRYTVYGDANLDGRVDGRDYARIDAGYLSRGTLTAWSDGDFNYDGLVDGSDYTLVDNAFNTQPPAPAGQASAAVAAPAAVQSAVPIPVLAGLAVMKRLVPAPLFTARPPLADTPNLAAVQATAATLLDADGNDDAARHRPGVDPAGVVARSRRTR